MTEAEDSTKMMNDHWAFLSSVMYEVCSIDAGSHPAEFQEFEKKVDNIEYGFKMAWPHAWKHGQEWKADEER